MNFIPKKNDLQLFSSPVSSKKNIREQLNQIKLGQVKEEDLEEIEENENDQHNNIVTRDDNMPKIKIMDD